MSNKDYMFKFLQKYKDKKKDDTYLLEKELSIKLHKEKIGLILSKEYYLEQLEEILKVNKFTKANFNFFKSILKDYKKNMFISIDEDLKTYTEYVNNLDIAKPEKKTKIKKKDTELKKEKGLLNYDSYTYSLKFLLSLKYNLYLKKNDDKELYFLLNKLNNNVLIMSKNNLNVFLKNNIKKEFGEYNKKFSGSDLIEFSINNEVLKNIFDIGFLPTDKIEFENEGEFYLNKYQLGEFEKKYFKTEFNKHLNNIIIYDTYKFPLIEKLIKHIIGDKRTYIEESLKFLDDKELCKKYLVSEYGHIWESEFTGKLNNKDLHITLLKNHFETELNKLTKEDDEETLRRYNYFSKWFAFILQNPLFKVPNGLAFITTQGVGKDRFVDWVLNPIFNRKNIKSVGQEDLKSTFAGWLKGVRIVICNELKFEVNSIAMYENLKRIMTNQYIAVNEKHQKGLENIINFSNWLFFGNNDNLLKIDKGDRRFTVFRQDNKIPKTITLNLSPDLTDKKGKLLNPNTLNNELGQFTQYLFHLGVTFQDIESPLVTEEKTEIQEYHKTDIETFIDEIKKYKSIIEFKKDFFLQSSELNEINKHIGDNGEETQPDFITYDLCYLMFNKIKEKNGLRGNRTSRSFHKALSKEGLKSQQLAGNTKVRFKAELMRGDNK